MLLFGKIRCIPFAALALFLSCAFTASAQNVFWKDIQENQIPSTQSDRWFVPKQYRTMRLSINELKNLLATAPTQEEVAAGEQGIEVSFPWPDGRMMRYRVWYAPIMAASLCAQFPEIRTYAGKCIDMPGATVWFDCTPLGFHAMTLKGDGGTAFIDPYARGNVNDYICHFKKDFVEQNGFKFSCGTEDLPNIPIPNSVTDRAGDCGKLRTYRLALAADGEYSNYFGATGANKAPALAAMNTSMNRVNGVYETEISVEMIMVANELNIIYTNPATDPYTNNNGSAMLAQNQTTCDAQIGTTFYDVGHVFSTGGGGVAYVGVPCNSGFKAQGVTGSPTPVGDGYDIDYVAHEMGHQFGAQHTFYGTTGSCNGNVTQADAFEPGSGSTIMAYAGICSPEDLQPHSDAYFHGISLTEIGNYVTSSSGNSCATPIANTNHAPAVPALANFTIPKSTPFVLTGSATDPDNDPLTYCWEQWNSEVGYTQPPASTNVGGPNFRSLTPVSNNFRYFPNLPDLTANNATPWEVVPSVGRTMSFRMSVRDNVVAGGCTTSQNNSVTVTTTSGPFLVTSPNTAVTYPGNSTQTVTWNVASTTSAPVSCANVDILISTDGGVTYSNLLLNTPNDGSQAVLMPSIITSTARIMVKCTNNIFFDISNVNFSLTTPLPIEMTSFQASLNGNRVDLDWSTATEKDNSGFQIERSTDVATDFKSIGWVDGAVNSTAAHRYAFEDRDIQNGLTYYYRLRQVGTDGQEQVSEVRVIRTGGTAGVVTFSPNPATSAAHLMIPGASGDAPRQITVWNSEGREIMSQSFAPGAALPVEDWTAGTYTVQVVIEGKTYTGQLLKH
jgi:hypothetical protein